MNLKHRVKISVANRNGTKQEVMQSRYMRLPWRLLRLIFGEFSEVLVLAPGESVQGIEIQRMRGDTDE